MKDPALSLIHILEAVEKIERYTKPEQPHFLSDTQCQDAVYRNFEIIGEEKIS